jgi:hypothetical protein
VQIVNLADFLENGIIVESAFFDKVESFDWEALRDKPVLVRGCDTAILPPWVFMTVAARLAGVAKRVRFGNEHSSIVVYSKSRDARESSTPKKPAGQQ